jgi:hypothetical protein
LLLADDSSTPRLPGRGWLPKKALSARKSSISQAVRNSGRSRACSVFAVGGVERVAGAALALVVDRVQRGAVRRAVAEAGGRQPVRLQHRMLAIGQ